MDFDVWKVMHSMTTCSAELEMSARALELGGYEDMSETLDAIAEKIRKERNTFCYDQSHKERR